MTPGGMTGLSAVILLLSGTIAYELVGDAAPMGPSGGPGRTALTVATNNKAAVPQSDPASVRQSDIDGRVSEVLARPVFSPDRRPVGTGTRSAAGLTRLTGIVITGSRKVAIFAAQAGGRPVVAEEGTRINAYELKAISDTGVTMVGPTGTMVMVPLFDPTPPPPPKRPSPPPAQPQPPKK
jgi:hypothetical protein